jgi:hypothetical protein
MFLGLRTATYRIDGIEKGKAWYSRVLGLEPYFDEPFYVGFNVAGCELGLQRARPAMAIRRMARSLTGVSKMPKPHSSK